LGLRIKGLRIKKIIPSTLIHNPAFKGVFERDGPTPMMILMISPGLILVNLSQSLFYELSATFAENLEIAEVRYGQQCTLTYRVSGK
jgi:hypothetical protein